MQIPSPPATLCKPILDLIYSQLEDARCGSLGMVRIDEEELTEVPVQIVGRFAEDAFQLRPRQRLSASAAAGPGVR